MTTPMRRQRSRAALYEGGIVRTYRASVEAPAEALAIRDGRILAVGSRDEVRKAAGRDPVVFDLGGATLMPGLIDTHPHLFHFGAIAHPLVDLSDARSHDDIVDRLPTKAAAVARVQWLTATPVGEPSGVLSGSVNNYYTGEPYMDALLAMIPLIQPEAIVVDRDIFSCALEDVAAAQVLRTVVGGGCVYDAGVVGASS